jgi:hypothetical protein
MSRNLYLVPHDFTPVGDAALQYAIHLGKRVNTEIQLIHIVTEQAKIAIAKQKLQKIIDSIPETNTIKISFLVQVGSIFEDISKIALKEHIKEDEDFVPYLDVIDEVIDSIDDIDLYKLDKEYLDISYVVLYKSIINLDEVYNLCKNYKL